MADEDNHCCAECGGPLEQVPFVKHIAAEYIQWAGSLKSEANRWEALRKGAQLAALSNIAESLEMILGLLLETLTTETDKEVEHDHSNRQGE